MVTEPEHPEAPEMAPRETAGGGFARAWSHARAIGSLLKARLESAAERHSRHYRARAFVKRDRAYLDEHDAESFVAAKLPEDEEVGVRCIWVMEVYLPSHFQTLLRRLDALGVDRNRLAFPLGDSLTSIRRARTLSMGGGWTNLGHLVPISNKGSLTGIPARLPPGVDSVFLTAISRVPSATVVVAQFRFDESTARSVEAPFRTNYRSTAIVHEKYIALPDGSNLRDEAIAEARARLARRCTRWIHENLPGTYAEFQDEPTPTCELLTFARANPLLERSPPARAADQSIIPVGPAPEPEPRIGHFWERDYLTILRQRDEWNAWACVEFPGLVLRLPSERKAGEHESDMVLSTRIADFNNGQRLRVAAAGEAATADGVTATTFYLNSTLAVFALAQAVIDYQARMALIRDRLGMVRLKFKRRTISELEQIAHDLAHALRNARPLFRGILAVPEWAWRHDIYTFVPIDDHRRTDQPLLSSVVESLLERAKRALDEEREVRDAVQTLMGLATTAANIRIQRALALLSVVAIIVAALAIPVVRAFLGASWTQISALAMSLSAYLPR